VVVALEIVKSFMLVSPHNVGDIALSVEITDFCVAVLFLDVVSDGLNQVGFSQANAAIDEQGVICGSRVFSHL
jgi:hypothetical protein